MLKGLANNSCVVILCSRCRGSGGLSTGWYIVVIDGQGQHMQDSLIRLESVHHVSVRLGAVWRLLADKGPVPAMPMKINILIKWAFLTNYVMDFSVLLFL